MAEDDGSVSGQTGLQAALQQNSPLNNVAFPSGLGGSYSGTNNLQPAFAWPVGTNSLQPAFPRPVTTPVASTPMPTATVLPSPAVSAPQATPVVVQSGLLGGAAPSAATTPMASGLALR
jgi:hypothetical protein